MTAAMLNANATPFCPHYGVCGGCSLQHLDEPGCHRLKLGRLKQVLAAAGLEAEVCSLQSVPRASRRRTTLVARKNKDGSLQLGYHPAQSHTVTDITTCPILVDPLQQFIPTLRQVLADLAFKTADIALTETAEGIDLQWLGRLSHNQRVALVEALVGCPALCRISLGEGDGAEVLYAPRPPVVPLGDRSVLLPPGAFLQASAAGERHLQQAVLERCPGQKVADLFSGLGTFALPLAQRGAEVLAVDSATPSLKALAAASQGLPLKVMERNLYTNPLMPEALDAFDALVLDPPRAGARAQCEALAGSQVKQVVYVSCNPTTFAQDAVILQKGGYRLRSVLPVDQFAWSAHLEIVADFSRS